MAVTKRRQRLCKAKQPRSSWRRCTTLRQECNAPFADHAHAVLTRQMTLLPARQGRLGCTCSAAEENGDLRRTLKHHLMPSTLELGWGSSTTTDCTKTHGSKSVSHRDRNRKITDCRADSLPPHIKAGIEECSSTSSANVVSTFPHSWLTLSGTKHFTLKLLTRQHPRFPSCGLSDSFHVFFYRF